MPKGPRGEKRPGDVIGAAVMVATGEVEDNATSADRAPIAGAVRRAARLGRRRLRLPSGRRSLRRRRRGGGIPKDDVLGHDAFLNLFSNERRPFALEADVNPKR